MRYSCRASVEYDLKLHYQLHDLYEKELKERAEYKGCLIKKSNSKKGVDYYTIRYPGNRKYTYIGKGSAPEIIKVREYAFYEEALAVIETNISALEGFLNVYRTTHAEHISELLPDTYRLPFPSQLLLEDQKINAWIDEQKRIKNSHPIFDPAGLKVTAFDGTLVRSRAEDIHLTGFYIYDVPAVFEVPYETENEVLRPDFTLLDVYDMSTKICEHLGNWFHDNIHKRNQYRTETIHRIDEYARIGFFPEKNLLLTFGSNDSYFDAQSIHRKIAMIALPPPDPETISLLKRC